jgi:hypothetical protein
MMTRFCSKKNYEQTGTKVTEIHSHHCFQCEQFKEKLSEIRDWDQADRHFAAHYRLSLISQLIYDDIAKMFHLYFPQVHAKKFRNVLAIVRFGHSLYLISMDEETECRSLYFSMDY